ncbi:MAG TPA: FISUMP domain-containing protein [Prolixibacteraceae bacterium]|nr:FISUMP domain-containing protein [Prolixibacteraceae bacterium]HQE52528.1 FISUMP domain-containing protein [Prolixibacteraceae bacterium]HQH76679.1 FISUMP domain-containing protein [Prolixibacteraceae bacterium]HQJ85777.1 FISUMP domain-containing protein [Prolixibacteraceae bacterium]
MKKLSPFVLLCVVVLKLTAQDITISFQPKEAVNTIDSIWVTNQRTNEKVKLLGHETLTLTKVTGITDLSFTSEKGYLYPNPCHGEAQVSFSTSLNQEVVLGVYNISGQLLSLERKYLTLGQHKFHITFPGTGLFIFSVFKDDGLLSFKVASMDSEVHNCNIEYSGGDILKSIKRATADITLGYAEGDNILYSIFSNKNNTIITDFPTVSKIYSVEFHECIDPDNKSYRIGKISNQWWMAENLNVGTMVHEAYGNPTDNGIIEKWCYNNEPDSCSKYGGLYRWDEMMQYTTQQGTRGICPPGWHIPTDEEWKVLEGAVDSQYGIGNTTWDNIGWRGSDAGTNLKSRSGWMQDYNGKDLLGFSGQPGGKRIGALSLSVQIRELGIWWTSTEYNDGYAWARAVTTDILGVNRYRWQKGDGYSVRCLRNE